MEEHDLLTTELAHMSDRSASDFLELLEALFASIDSHYYAKVARYRRRLREEASRTPLTTASLPDTEEPF